MSDDLKGQLRLKKLLRDYGGTPKFSAENDHNPLVLEKCPNCLGSGKACGSKGDLKSGYVEELAPCNSCNQTGITGRVVLLFDNDSPALQVVAGEEGWVTCPKDNWRFTITDPRAWTGLRHKRCGQKLIVARS